MLTKPPDYTISELGCPQLQQHLCSDSCCKKLRVQAPSFRRSPSVTPSPSPTRLLPLRETLADYNKRLLSEQAESCGTSRQRQQQQQRELDDKLAQQKKQKNLWNEQQQKQQQQLQWTRPR